MSEAKAPPRILAIAGSDSSGGAGIQADIKTITMLGGFAMTAVTAVTAQNSVGVQAIAPMGEEIVLKQITSCAEDIGVDAIKIGMVHDEEVIGAVATGLAAIEQAVPVVLDPVMIASSGAALIAPDAAVALREKLFTRATLLTPNLPELALLTDKEVGGENAIIEAALALSERHNCAVLAKGGHGEGDRIVDILIKPDGSIARFEDQRIETHHTHGTGCTLSSAIATLLGHGQPMEHAVRLGRQFVRHAILHAPGFGAGHGPLGHQGVRTLAGDARQPEDELD